VQCLLGIGYLLFVIYGSLVPLEYRARPFAEAWQQFLNIRYLELGIESRSDWVANLLLFIPLSFLWLGIFWPRRSIFVKVLASVVLFAASVSLATGIEFTQIYFPPRTVSFNDIFAESMGALTGIFLWWSYGEKALHWFSGWHGAGDRLNLARRILYVYLFILFGYSLMPLDLTLSLGELFDKWKEGRLILTPFGYAYPSTPMLIYGFFTETLIWLPVGFLWQLCTTKGKLTTWCYAILAAVLLEMMQLFVYTRITDITDILSAALGAGIGTLLAARLHAAKPIRESGITRAFHISPWFFIWSVLFSVWCGVILFSFLYPFNFIADIEVVKERFLAFRREVPFQSYYFSTEYVAITALLRKITLFIPLGALLALVVSKISHPFWRRIGLLGSFTLILLFAYGVEIGQLFLADRVASNTDWFLEMLGGAIGYIGLSYMYPTFFSFHTGVHSK